MCFFIGAVELVPDSMSCARSSCIVSLSLDKESPSTELELLSSEVELSSSELKPLSSDSAPAVVETFAVVELLSVVSGGAESTAATSAAVLIKDRVKPAYS